VELINHPSYLALWPENLDSPVSVKVIKDHWDGNLPVFAESKELAEDYDFGRGPGAVVLMPNGATYTLQYLHPYRNRDGESSFDGNWEEYTNGDRFTFEKIRTALDRALNMVAIDSATRRNHVDG
jgi:hypothetical protein